jgi:multicomponent Na+:H+ antiporter subunit B
MPESGVKSLLLEQLAKILVPLLLAVSLFFLLRGHDLPGGGFIGGLAAAASFIILGLSTGPAAVAEALKVPPSRFMGLGILVAVLSGVPGLLFKGSFMKGVWWEIDLAAGPIKIGTPLIFDIGIYLIVLGMTTSIYLSLGKED